MRAKFRLVAIIIFLLLLLPSVVVGQEEERELLVFPFSVEEGLGVPNTFCGKPQVTTFGLYDRRAPAMSPDVLLNGRSSSDIPTQYSAFQHWWKSFEIIMIAEKQLYGCIQAIKEHQLRLGMPCMIDDLNCSPQAPLILIQTTYWPHGDIPQCANKETFIAHFDAAVFGINQLLPQVEACQLQLEFMRTIPTP